jgi:hypothetical protein
MATANINIAWTDVVFYFGSFVSAIFTDSVIILLLRKLGSSLLKSAVVRNRENRKTICF